jgi:hypothetical protein
MAAPDHRHGRPIETGDISLDEEQLWRVGDRAEQGGIFGIFRQQTPRPHGIKRVEDPLPGFDSGGTDRGGSGARKPRQPA